MRSLIVLSVGLITTIVTANANAHNDILLRSDGVRVLVGGVADLEMAEGGPYYDLDTRVFEGVLINPATPTPPFGFDFERDEPGFYSDPTVPVGQNLPAGAEVRLKLDAFTLGGGTDTTFYWDGGGAVNFAPLTSSQPGVAFTFSPAAPSPFATVSGGSSFDDHPLFGLTGGAADGVYLTRMRLEVEGLLESDAFYIAWLASSVLVDDATAEELEEALEAYEGGGPAPVVGGVDFSFFEEAVEFANTIPEPSAALLSLTACVGVTARRKR